MEGSDELTYIHFSKEGINRISNSDLLSLNQLHDKYQDNHKWKHKLHQVVPWTKEFEAIAPETLF